MSPSTNQPQQKYFSVAMGKITALKIIIEVEITTRDVRHCRDYDIVLQKYATHTANAIYIRENLNIISHFFFGRHVREVNGNVGGVE